MFSDKNATKLIIGEEAKVKSTQGTVTTTPSYVYIPLRSPSMHSVAKPFFFPILLSIATKEQNPGESLPPKRLTVNDFNTVNEGLKHFIAHIPISRIRSLVKHVKNEFQVLSVLLAKQTVVQKDPKDHRTEQNANEVSLDPLFNFLTLEKDNTNPAKSAFKYDTKVFTIPVGRAFTILQDAMAVFVHNSKLINDFVHYFKIKRQFHRSGDGNGNGNRTPCRDRSVHQQKSGLKSPTLDVQVDMNEENSDNVDCVSDNDNDSEGDCDMREVEIVCESALNDDHGHANEDELTEDIEVEDLFGTTTVLSGTKEGGRLGNSTNTGKRKKRLQKNLSFKGVEENILIPGSAVYAEVVQVFALSAATLVISQVPPSIL